MIIISLAVIALIAGIDLGIKSWVEKNVPFRKDKKILGGFGILRRVHNKGMMMNFGDKHPNVVKNISVFVTLAIGIVQLVFLGMPGYIKEKVGLSLILGGAVSNTADRVKRGYVVDYFGFNSKNKKISRVTYNIGDFAIFAGGLIAILSVLGNER